MYVLIPFERHLLDVIFILCCTFVTTISNFYSMRKFILLLAMLLPLFAFEMNADEKEVKWFPMCIDTKFC